MPMARWLRGPAALELLGQRFDDLVHDAGVPITARRVWLQTWADTYRDHEPWIAVVDRPDGTLDGAAVLSRRSRAGVVDITNLGRGQSDYACLAVREGAAGDLADLIVSGLGALTRPWRLRVEQLPADDPVARAIAARLPVAEIHVGDPNPYVELDPARSAEQHMAARLRKNLHTTDNRLRREGVKVEFIHVADPLSIGAYLPEIETVWRARDRAVGRRSDADDRTGFAFFLAAVRRLANEGEVELSVLLLKGEMAAFAVCFLDGPAYRVWVPRIAPRFGVYGPGHLLTRELLDRALARGCGELDWMRGEEPYKRQTATASRGHEHLMAWSSPAMRAATEGARRTRTAVAEFRESRARSGA
jgi:CelD/BcsL family acetyltransferase involved in cellulose biosynthesis